VQFNSHRGVPVVYPRTDLGFGGPGRKCEPHLGIRKDLNDASHREVRRHGGPSRNEMFGKKRSFHPSGVLEIVVQTLDEGFKSDK